MANADAVRSAVALGRTILEHRLETEAQRRLAAPIVAGLTDSRLNRIALTPENGGLALPAVQALEVYEALARSEASVAWVVWNNALPCLFSRFLSREERAGIFSDPNWMYANSTRPSGKAVVEGDGFRVSGRWSLVSGCELAEWMLLLCVIEEDGRVRTLGAGSPDTRFMFVHRQDVEILDTWNVGGMRGTGSHDVLVEDHFVPRARSLSPADPCTVVGPFARIPIIGVVAAGFAAQTIGVAQGAVDAAVALGKTKITPGPVPDMRDRPAVQLAIAEDTAALEAARGHLHESVEALWDLAEQGCPIEVTDIAKTFMASRHAQTTACAIVDAMFSAAGTSAIYRDCPLERAVRDVRIMQQHVLAQSMWAEDAGRVLLGLPPINPLFAV